MICIWDRCEGMARADVRAFKPVVPAAGPEKVTEQWAVNTLNLEQNGMCRHGHAAR
jgi:hypothetical protein